MGQTGVSLPPCKVPAKKICPQGGGRHCWFTNTSPPLLPQEHNPDFVQGGHVFNQENPDLPGFLVVGVALRCSSSPSKVDICWVSLTKKLSFSQLKKIKGERFHKGLAFPLPSPSSLECSPKAWWCGSSHFATMRTKSMCEGAWNRWRSGGGTDEIVEPVTASPGTSCQVRTINPPAFTVT